MKKLTDRELVEHIAEHLVNKGYELSIHDMKYIITFAREVETTAHHRIAERLRSHLSLEEIEKLYEEHS